MLRTHGELGYKQEQRFHLELGLLKMAHAQRLLPIEQLLSEAATASRDSRSPSRPAVISDTRGPSPAAPARANYVSPFAADSARKSSGKPELSTEAAPASGPRIVASANSSALVIMGSAAPEVMADPISDRNPEIRPEPVTPQPQVLDDVRDAVLNALGDAGHRMLVSMLETGEWTVDGNELIIKVSSSTTVIDMSLGAEARRLAIATASGVLGKAIKLKVLPGGTAQAAPVRPQSASNGGGRARAEQDPIVRRLQEKFGAEIRTIIDQREKR
jgi:DNA polymerase-3 subunit gamma/tau